MKTITNLWKSFFGKGFAAVFSEFAKYDAEGTEIHTALASQVSDVAYDTTNKKLTKTSAGTTSDVVTAATLKSDMSLDNVDNKSAATLKTEFTGAVAQGDTGFPTGGDVYTAIENNGKGLAVFDIELTSSGALPSTGLPTFSEIDTKVNAGFNVVIRTINSYDGTAYEYYRPVTYSSAYGLSAYAFSRMLGNGNDIISVQSNGSWEKVLFNCASAIHYHGDNSTTGITSGGTAPSGVTDASQKVMFGNGSWKKLTDKITLYNNKRNAETYSPAQYTTISTWDKKDRIAVVTYTVKNQAASTSSVRMRLHNGTSEVVEPRYCDILAYGTASFTFAIDTRNSAIQVQVKSNMSSSQDFVIWSSGFEINSTL